MEGFEFTVEFVSNRLYLLEHTRARREGLQCCVHSDRMDMYWVVLKNTKTGHIYCSFRITPTNADGNFTVAYQACDESLGERSLRYYQKFAEEVFRISPQFAEMKSHYKALIDGGYFHPMETVRCEECGYFFEKDHVRVHPHYREKDGRVIPHTAKMLAQCQRLGINVNWQSHLSENDDE